MAYLGKTTSHWFHYNAFPETFIKARKLRKKMTPAENKMWSQLRNRKLFNYKIRRQHPVGQFIVDFFCVEKQLVIEIDGKIHLRSEIIEHDENRTAELERLGLRIIRFTNDEVMTDMECVLGKIKEQLDSLP